MPRSIKNLFVGFVVLAAMVTGGSTLAPTPAHAAACGDSGTFFGFPHWWRGLGNTETNPATKKPVCSIKITAKDNFKDIWTIAVNLIDILLRLIGLVAVGFVIFGGVRYIISQGNSGQITVAKQTIQRALIGLVLAVSAVFILNFIAGNILNLTVDKDTYQVSSYVVTEAVV